MICKLRASKYWVFSPLNSIPYFLLANHETKRRLILRGTDREGTYDIILLEQMYHRKGELLRFRGETGGLISSLFVGAVTGEMQ
ncbi:hypothetical protein Y032_0018g3724 [Ancylostoma ceylanicum]|uniref:Uncharacterized protein n=1 Tax=Ancylostoma ceylanicum TaxID=53326 RepID=A0A016V3W1_9BILA|nr:hypothetical protein Y032_0018g3724 [Ancylostoma ceylanicum]